jgi:putative redox protein
MTIVSETEKAGAFRQIVRVDAHTLHADVGVADGGEASAPGPHDYFDLSLATCKALTAVWYAKRHSLALDRVVARVTRDDSRERQGTYALRVTLEFEGRLSPADSQRLYDAVGKCPVHKLMTTSTIEIETAPLLG